MSVRFHHSVQKFTQALPAPLQAIIDENWAHLTSKNSRLFNGGLVHFESIQKVGTRTEFQLASGLDYKTVVGLRSASAQIPVESHARAFGVMIALVTSDNQLIFRWRESGDWQPSFEMPGGFIRPGEHPLLESSALRLQDDLGLEANDTDNPEYLSFYELPEIFEAVILVRVQTPLTAEEVLKSVRGFSIPNFASAIEGLLDGEFPLHPPTREALKRYAAHFCKTASCSSIFRADHESKFDFYV